MKPLINIDELLKIRKSNNLIIVNAGNGEKSKENYEKKHLENSIFVSLDEQLANIEDGFSNGGRHPLPDIKKFAEVLGDLGITKNSHIVIYDEKNGSNASARFWWMLVAVGHEKVQILNGGIQEAERRDFPMSSSSRKIAKAEPYKVTHWKLGTIEIKQIENILEDRRYIIIDVREAKRYNGEIEPIDLIAGHIPNAVNVPFTENLDEDGFFLSQEELKLKYQKIFRGFKAENIVVHCGSGVTACHTLFAIALAGLEIPKTVCRLVERMEQE